MTQTESKKGVVRLAVFLGLIAIGLYFGFMWLAANGML
jgi:hypothetical protein